MEIFFIILIFIILSICFVTAFSTVLEDEIAGMWLGIVFSGFITVIIVLLSNSPKEQYPQPTYVDVPEEWQSISTDKNKPDGVLIHRSKDSLFIQFTKGCVK